MNNKPHIFGFLSTIDNPLLPSWISGAISYGVQNIVVICDSRLDDEKSKQIWQERTGGYFERDSGGTDGIYTLHKPNIPFYFVESHNDNRTIELLNILNISCLFNAGTPRKLSSEILSSVDNGIINIHPGILPGYRGCTAVEWAILNDDRIGNTAHFMDHGYDTGPIIESEWYDFPEDADYQLIRTTVYRNGCILAGKVLSLVQANNLKTGDAVDQNSSEGKYWSPIPKDDMAKVLEIVSSGTYRYQCL